MGTAPWRSLEPKAHRPALVTLVGLKRTVVTCQKMTIAAIGLGYAVHALNLLHRKIHPMMPGGLTVLG